MTIIIVGLDPGSTTGVAVLDLFGNILSLHSSKRLGISEVIKLLSSIGSPIIISTDVSKPPFLVETVSSKFDALLVHPKHDLHHKEKGRLVRDYNMVKFSNWHENDALAAAVYALKRYKNMISKIQRKVDSEIFERLTRDIILRRVNNIKVGIKKYK